jgi:hypothetical protein
MNFPQIAQIAAERHIKISENQRDLRETKSEIFNN